jgi:hypothetical protein
LSNNLPGIISASDTESSQCSHCGIIMAAAALQLIGVVVMCIYAAVGVQFFMEEV